MGTNESFRVGLRTPEERRQNFHYNLERLTVSLEDAFEEDYIWEEIRSGRDRYIFHGSVSGDDGALALRVEYGEGTVDERGFRDPEDYGMEELGDEEVKRAVEHYLNEEWTPDRGISLQKD